MSSGSRPWCDLTESVLLQVINETEKGVQGIGAGVQGLARELGGGFQRGPPPPPTVTQVFEGRVPVASSPQASGDLCVPLPPGPFPPHSHTLPTFTLLAAFK